MMSLFPAQARPLPLFMKAKRAQCRCFANLEVRIEAMGLVALCVEEEELEARSLEVARRLAEGAPSAIRFTKHSLKMWLGMAGPTFDGTLALEMLGFSGAEAAEGLAAHQEKRAPRFPETSPF